MARLTATTKRRLRRATNAWARVKGPAAAMIASCGRLGWTVVSSTELITDQGETLDLLLDSPAAVKLEVARAVKRWRWRNLEVLMPQLKKGGSGVGALMEPIAKPLKSKDNNEAWNPALRGSLRSALTGRQYPQARAYAAGWTLHSKCIFCIHHIVEFGARTGRRTRPVAASTSPSMSTIDQPGRGIEPMPSDQLGQLVEPMPSDRNGQFVEPLQCATPTVETGTISLFAAAAVWSNSARQWFEDGIVVEVHGDEVTVQFNEDRQRKALDFRRHLGTEIRPRAQQRRQLQQRQHLQAVNQPGQVGDPIQLDLPGQLVEPVHPPLCMCVRVCVCAGVCACVCVVVVVGVVVVVVVTIYIHVYLFVIRLLLML